MATAKQIAYGKRLEQKMKIKVSPWKRFTSKEASDRIKTLLVYDKYNIDPNSINWKDQVSKALAEVEKNKKHIASGESYRAHQQNSRKAPSHDKGRWS